MLFNSFEYIFLFLPVTLLIYFSINKFRLFSASKFWLFAASLFFYSWWNIRYLPLISGSIVFNYLIGRVLIRSEENGFRKLILISGIVSNLGLLIFFKYTDFLLDNINYLSGTNFELLKLVLPLGISFFTFTQIAYLVDAYRKTSGEYDFLNYALFVTFFPHLLAGPILHHKEMMPQFERKRNKVLNYRNLSLGLFLFFIGLFKKVVLADSLAITANAGYGMADKLTLLESWVTSLSYTFQLYFDFSGYTDMALGSALMFNIRLPINFNSPYKALNIQDFWRRWHITLSRFLRDYIYIPLGGNRVSESFVLANLMLTFLIGGIWHGAGWNFLFWGFLHGAALILLRFWKRLHMTMPKALAWFLTFNFINVTWVFFRAKSWQQAFSILKGMAGFNGVIIPKELAAVANRIGVETGNWLANIKDPRETILRIAILMAVSLALKNSNAMAERFNVDWKKTVLVLIIAYYSILNLGQVNEFLYFNF